MHIKKREVTIIECTPLQLHSIADKLDSLWKVAIIGQDVPKIVEIDWNNNIEVRFVIDQQEKYNEERLSSKVKF